MDKEYQEHFAAKDTAELEKRLKDGVASALEEKAAEGEDLTSAEKESIKK